MKKNKENNTKVVTYRSSTQTVDKSTGELILLSSEEKTRVEREPDYIKLYVKDLVRFMDVPAGMDKILLAFLSNMGYNNVIPTYMPLKKMISKELNVSISYINKAVDMFHKSGIFIRYDRGLYIADPELFGRGKWEDIKELRLNILYSKNGQKTITSSLSEQLKLEI